MHTIEIDFDVFKKLTLMRESESVTYNDVIRKLLGLSPATNSRTDDATSSSSDAWTTKGVVFPAGTEFRATHKGNTILARVASGGLLVDGKLFTSPSAAAVAITGSPANGWVFWECKLPGRSSWQILKALRK